MARERTDTHRPQLMVPGEYVYLAFSFGFPVENLQTGNDQMEIEWDGTEEWEALGSPEHSTCAHARDGQCDHCGAAHKYQVILRHVPTGDILSIGHQCYSERFSRPDWQRVIADQAKRAETRAKRASNVARAVEAMDEPTRAAYEWGLTEMSSAIGHDIAGKVEQFGPLSEKQSAFLVRLHAEALEKARQIAEGEIVPCPVGKVEITGTLVCAKWVENDFGGAMKATIRDDRGFRVYGTLPSKLSGVENGTRIAFSATVEPSAKDPTFGFYSRPTKPRVVEAEPQQS